MSLGARSSRVIPISINLKLTISLLLMALIPIVTLGTINYFKTTDIFNKSIQNFLFEISRSKEAVLENYIETTEFAAQTMAETDVFQEYLAFPEMRYLSPQQKLQREAVKKQVENLLYSFQETHWKQYHHIFLINKFHEIVISPNHGKEVKGSPSSHLGEDTSENKWAAQALVNGVTTVSDFSSWVESDHNHQMLFYPVKGAGGETLAAIGFELQIPYEQKLLTENLRLGESGKAFLTTTDGVPIVYKNTDKLPPLETEGIKEAIEKGFSSGLRLNGDGVEVVDMYLKNKKYPWILVAEIEAKEAFHDLVKIQKSMIFLGSITLIVAIVFAILLSRLIVNPIKHLTRQVEEVSKGRLDIKIDGTKRQDEIGKLVRAFNRTIMSLKITMKNYKK
jgi:HAMP domain-containing protein